MAKKKVKKGTKTRSARPVKHKEEKQDSQLTLVFSTILALFFAVFVAISNMHLGGAIGDVIRSIVLSTFGTMGYLFPFVIIIAILITLLNKKSANVKIYSLLIFYFMIICLLESILHDFTIEKDVPLSDCISESIKRVNEYGIAFLGGHFSGGVIGTGISYITFHALGKAGSIALFSAIAIISFIILFGLGLSKFILKILKAIVMFIPNIFIKRKQRLEEDRQIAIDNENILKATIEKSREVNDKQQQEVRESNGRLVLDPLEEKHDDGKKVFDTSRLNISSEDIQSRFYDVDKDDRYEKTHLLNELHKKSINEVICENEGIKPDDFFHTEGMKPISETDIQIPEPKVDIPIINTNVTSNIDDEKDFASGLDDLRKDDDGTLDYRNMTAHEVLQNTHKDIVVKNDQQSTYEDPITKNITHKRKHKKYAFPPKSLLTRSEKKTGGVDPKLTEKAEILRATLEQFGVGVTVTNITVGPSVTRFELKPDIGVKISKILSLENDVKLALAASEIRIEAPIPGKSAIGIEIPNKESSGVMLGDIINSHEFSDSKSPLTVAIGKDISGQVIVTDLKKMPHLLIAGATGSGKSVCINSIITSLIYKASPDDVRLIMVDPKVVELQVYEGIPHLLVPVVTNPKKAAGALNWAVNEMTRRYNLIQEKRVRDIESYNASIEGEINKIGVSDENEASLEQVAKLPYIVIIIDEFADLMMVASKEVENSIMRIAQLARACGIYLVIATQRPSVNVISGSIKTNVPSRISFAVSSGVDSQTVLDRRGAEKLLGHGDMLYFPQWLPEPVRVQGCYVTEDEILNIVSRIKETDVQYDENAEQVIEKGASSDSGSSYDPNEKDDLYEEAGRLVIEQQNASIGMLQRRYRIGFNRAARIIDQLEANGVLSRQDGKKPREVLMTIEEFMETLK